MINSGLGFSLAYFEDMALFLFFFFFFFLAQILELMYMPWYMNRDG